MGGLLSSIYVGISSLKAQQLALDVTGNNVANVNTPGYTRQQAILEPNPYVPVAQGLLGTGVRVASIQAIRDRFLDAQINQESQRQGALNTLSGTLKQVEGVFNEIGSTGIQSAVSRFFNSFSDLANRPTNMAFRQQVLGAANDLASIIRDDYSRLEQLQRQNDQDVRTTVNRINALLDQVAQLNPQISSLELTRKNASGLRDQRQAALGELSGLMNITTTETETGSISISAGNGKVLAIENKAYPLQTVQVSPSPFYSVLSGSTDITAAVTGGKLGALLQGRDIYIPSYLRDLDTLATTLIGAVNAQHVLGTDLSGAAGGNFFAPAAGAGAARNISVAVTDPTRIAAAAAGAAVGDNTNALAIAGLQRSRLISGSTMSEFYSILLSKVGTDSKNTNDSFQSEKAILTQLKNQRDSVSAVSLDEEAANVVQFQKAYEAASRMIGVVNSLTEETMRIVR